MDADMRKISGRKGPRGRSLTISQAQEECEKASQTIECNRINHPKKYPWRHHQVLKNLCRQFSGARSNAPDVGIVLADGQEYTSALDNVLAVTGSNARVYLFTPNSDPVPKHWLAWQHGVAPTTTIPATQAPAPSDPNWYAPCRVGGTTAKVIAGCFSNDAGGGSKGWFPSRTTIILGIDSKRKKSKSATQATWKVPVALQYLTDYSQAFLCFGCLRAFGGLHSAKPKSRVQIWVNQRQIDDFRLRVIPEHHDDYFHRSPLPRMLRDEPFFSHFSTVYVWPLARDVLNNADTLQEVTVDIAPGTCWDIDEVAFLIHRI